MSITLSNPSVDSTAQDILDIARQVVMTERDGIDQVLARFGASLVNAVELMLACRGRVIVVGMGKSGIIGQKISATFASTGTPSFSVHPGEAFHGDLGMISAGDLVLMISYSGETEELIRILPFLEHQANVIVSLTGNTQSTLARHANVTIDVAVDREACNNNLAPTASTTASLVVGDVLAVVISTLRGFKPEDFARFHPGGSLGRRLLTLVRDVMHKDNLPICEPSSSFKQVIHVISRGRLGVALVVEKGRLAGVISDGDLRRTLEKYDEFSNIRATDMMTSSPQTVYADERVAVAEERMRSRSINNLVVVDATDRAVGILQIYAA